MKIGLDLDGVVYHWTEGAAAAFEKYRGYARGSLIREQTHWNHLMEEVTAADWEWLWRGPGLEAQHENPDCVYPGAGRAMRRLAASGYLIVATHRPPRAAPGTARFLAHHRVQFAELHVMGSHVAKSGVWANCDVILEDKISNIEDAIDNTSATVFAPRRSDNSDELDVLQAQCERTTVCAGRLQIYTDIREVTRWVRAQTNTTTR